MNYNNILILLIFFTSTATVITNGVLMIKEKDVFTLHDSDSFKTSYIICLIYNEIYLFLCLLYNIIFYLYYCIFCCYNDNEIKITYNCWKAIFLFSGIATHIYSFFILVTQNSVINDNVHSINIVFNANFIFIILISCIFKVLKCNNTDNNILEYKTFDKTSD